uniref:T-box domain-containing protein n=1 Tax=Petromyzon marinus TaxID=7757 RepID=S4RQZ4_PETMA
GFQVTLDNREVWERFHSWGTEMILTKTGRRMFPYCRYKVRGLDPQSCYLMAIDVVPVDGHRYRWGEGCWMPIERGKPQIPDSVYVHQEGVAPGSFWMYESISFSEVKLTNTALGQDGVISLIPMFKYVTRFHIIRANKVPRHLRLDADNVHTFIFPQTEFFAVTAYQNTAITHLKISHSPLAWSAEPKSDALNQDEEGGGDGSGRALNSQQGARERVSLGSSGKRDHACMVGTNDRSYDASRGDGSVGMLEEDVLSDKSTNGDGVKRCVAFFFLFIAIFCRNKSKRDDNSNGCKDQNTLFDIRKVKDEPNDTWQELVENVDPPSSLGGKGESQVVLQNISLSDCLLPAGNSTCKSNLISKVESARAGAMIVPTSVEQDKDPKCPTSHHPLNQNLFPVVRLKQCNISKPTVKLGELPASVLYSYSIPQISLSRSACGDRPLIVLVSESPPHWSEPTDDVKPSKLCLSEGNGADVSDVEERPGKSPLPIQPLPTIPHLNNEAFSGDAMDVTPEDVKPTRSELDLRLLNLTSVPKDDAKETTEHPDAPRGEYPRGRRVAPRGLAWEAPTQRADAAATATHHDPRMEHQADRVDVGGVSFFSFSNKSSCGMHSVIGCKIGFSLRSASSRKAKGMTSQVRVHWLSELGLLFKIRTKQGAYPRPQNLNTTLNSTHPQLPLPRFWMSFTLHISVLEFVFSNCSGADPRFVSRTGKTNDVTKIKGWQHKFGLQAPASSSGSAPDMNTLGKNRSVFLSDKLDEYLQEEEKLLEQRPNMYASKAAGVTFQTPRTGSTYVRTLDSVLRRRAGPARSAGTCATSPPPPPPLPLSGVTQKRGALAGRGKISTAALRATQKSFKRGTRGKRCSRGGRYGSRGGKYGGRAEVVATAAPLASPKKVTLPSSPPLTPPSLKPARSCPVSGAALVKNANSRNVNTMLLALEELALLDGKHRTYITTDRAERSITTLLTPQMTATATTSTSHSSSPSSTPAASGRCQKEFCRLGCVCDSLGEGRAVPAHCGRPECMLECSCPPQARR